VILGCARRLVLDFFAIPGFVFVISLFLEAGEVAEVAVEFSFETFLHSDPGLKATVVGEYFVRSELEGIGVGVGDFLADLGNAAVDFEVKGGGDDAVEAADEPAGFHHAVEEFEFNEVGWKETLEKGLAEFVEVGLRLGSKDGGFGVEAMRGGVLG
jgi:hypothetical protein